MKNLLFSLCLMAATNLRAADIIAQWNFNSAPADANQSTGSTLPSIGSGTFTIAGLITNGFASGAPLDPAPSADNTAINLGVFPTQGASNKQAGVRFAVSTAGYTNISISWAHRVSNTGSRFWRLQYSANGVDFVDYPTQTVITNGSTANFSNQVASLAAFTSVEDNGAFVFQIVAEFDSSGTAYAGAGNTSSYNSGTGVVRFDYVTVSGDVAGVVNAAPTISPITNVTMRANSAYPAIPFTVGDAETPAASLIVDRSSSNTGLLPLSAIVLDGIDSNRTVTLTPIPEQTGSALVTLIVQDENGKSNVTVFAVNVIPTNIAPTVSAILNQGTTVDTPTAAIPFTIGDAETAASNLTVTAYSSNTVVLPQGSIVLGGTNANRTISLAPAAGQAGNALVSISVSDGVFTTNRTFVLSVLPSAGTLLYEPFNYPDGPLIVNSLGLWQNHSGSTGELSTAGQSLFVTANNSEDVDARLRGEPYTPAGGANLYYSFRVSAYNLPTPLGDYFAHFKDNGSNFRGKLFVSTMNAAAGYYRIGVANGASFPTNAGYAEAPTDITFDQTNLVVVRYNVAAGTTTLWLNPTAESDESFTASDPLGSTNSVTQFAIRESRFQGDLYVDDVLVATSFDEVLGRLPQIFRLRITHGYLYWPAAATTAGFVLESTSNLTTPNWQTVNPTGTQGDENVLNFSNPAGNAFFRLRKP